MVSLEDFQGVDQVVSLSSKRNRRAYQLPLKKQPHNKNHGTFSFDDLTKLLALCFL